MSVSNGYCTLFIEAHEGKCLSEVLLPRIRNLLYKLNRLAGAGNRVRRGLAVLKSFAGTIKVTLGEIELGLDISPEKGTADSGHLEMDLTDLFIAVAEAAEDKNTPIVILIDEIQFFKAGRKFLQSALRPIDSQRKRLFKGDGECPDHTPL